MPKKSCGKWFADIESAKRHAKIYMHTHYWKIKYHTSRKQWIKFYVGKMLPKNIVSSVNHSHTIAIKMPMTSKGKRIAYSRYFKIL